MNINAAINPQCPSSLTIKATLLNNKDHLLDVEKLLITHFKKHSLKSLKVA